MDLFNKAFGNEFEPHLDKDAAIKFILNCLLMGHELDRLIELLDTSLEIGCIEGEPGWELERVEDKDRNLPGYSNWPEWAYYRAAVDPDSYQLSYPEAYYGTAEFMSFLKKALDAYLEQYPGKSGELEKLLHLIAD